MPGPAAGRTVPLDPAFISRKRVIKMHVLVVIRKSPVRRFLVELHTNRLVREVARLAGKRKNSQAIVTALTKGKFEREVGESDLPGVKADLILTEENARWDLTA